MRFHPSLQSLAESIVLRTLSAVRGGSLRIETPEGKQHTLGDAGQTHTLRVHDRAFFKRLVLDGDIALGDTYTAGLWSTDDLTALLRFFIRQGPALQAAAGRFALLGKALARLRHRRHRNTIAGSRANIHAHYDLGNDFFECFLDPSMTYSCGIYDTPSDTLETAQRNKRRAMIERARLHPEHHLLEIGSGWGALAIEAAQQTGCRVTTVTLSTEQLERARQRVAAAGLQDRVQVELCDYRQIQGSFDRIISVEMLEAVGHEFLQAFFACCDRLLKPQGLLALQVITITDQRYDDYRVTPDWIQKAIFPGGLLPSLTALCQAATHGSRLVVEQVDNIGRHYARTLRDWDASFAAASQRIAALGFGDCDRRRWHYYFSYCEAAFAERILGTLQMTMTRESNSDLDPVPYRREHATQPDPAPPAAVAES